MRLSEVTSNMVGLLSKETKFYFDRVARASSISRHEKSVLAYTPEEQDQ